MLEIINTVFKIATFLFKKNIPRTARRINASKRFIGMLIFDCGLNDIARSRAQNINRNIRTPCIKTPRIEWVKPL